MEVTNEQRKLIREAGTHAAPVDPEPDTVCEVTGIPLTTDNAWRMYDGNRPTLLVCCEVLLGAGFEFR